MYYEEYFTFLKVIMGFRSQPFIVQYKKQLKETKM